jgi:uncharacterized membrane protein YfcA
MSLDPWVVTAGFVVGTTVGLTGMGGGALMTPILVLLFRVQPLAAVSSDLVAAVVMKPVGGSVHLRRGTVHLQLVKWLCLGSVPSAFAGVLVLRAMGNGNGLQDRIKLVLGIALLLAASAILAKSWVQRGRTDGAAVITDVAVHPFRTLLIGVAGGLVVGMTSVGSGSLMIVFLLLLYPQLSAKQLVGTDLVQAIPLVASAAAGHLLFGDFKLGLTAALLLGSVPGVYLGARLSAAAPDTIIRPLLVAILTLSGLKLVGLSNLGLGWAAGASAVALIGVAGVRLLRKADVAPAPPRGAGMDDTDRQDDPTTV